LPPRPADVALANKNAQVIWALLAHDRHYQPSLQHEMGLKEQKWPWKRRIVKTKVPLFSRHDHEAESCSLRNCEAQISGREGEWKNPFQRFA
jgi:hypothetical protein